METALATSPDGFQRGLDLFLEGERPRSGPWSWQPKGAFLCKGSQTVSRGGGGRMGTGPLGLCALGLLILQSSCLAGRPGPSLASPSQALAQGQSLTALCPEEGPRSVQGISSHRTGQEVLFCARRALPSLG